jgi:PAS domain S-box-containing protein
MCIRDSVTFALIMISLCVWSFASVFETGAMSLEEKLLWSKCQYIGIATLPPLWLYFAAEFTHQKPFSRLVRWTILSLSAITLVMAFTNEYHYLLWSKITILPGPMHIAKYDHGPWFYVHIVFTYLLLLIGTFWLIKALLKLPPSKRRQIYILIFGLIIGWSANVLYITGLFPVEGLDITPLSFTFIAFIVSWNIFQFRLFDIVPIARDILLDNMADGVIVLDPNDIIIDINPAAQALIGKMGDRKLLGLTLWEALGEYAGLLNSFKGQPDFSTEVKISDVPQRYIGFNVSRIRDSQKHNVGKIVVIFNITKRKLI